MMSLGILTKSDDMSLMSASFGKFRKAFVLTQSTALSPMNAIHLSINDDALLPPKIYIENILVDIYVLLYSIKFMNK